ncbi:hypothetical protein O53_2572 [Microcystis aeruginosa TAIHU98]|uniref:Uncharacterized protein n=1 Tax=Microcystis aeruginosa TAIHU98 TaxID=1134457 RepID=L7E2T8_MICAE|nr:hypothetical protein O53_2572 [Microcystis aeruginosa TAIHU98]ODV36836.1 hypothetical protein BFG60_3683 [Microcystis aeruginosa NIES-98]
MGVVPLIIAAEAEGVIRKIALRISRPARAFPACPFFGYHRGYR